MWDSPHPVFTVCVVSRLLYLQWIHIRTFRVWFTSSMGGHLKQRSDKSCPAKGLSFSRAWVSSLDSDDAERLWWEGRALALHFSCDRVVPHKLQDLQSWWIRSEAFPKSPTWLFWASSKTGSCQGRCREEDWTTRGTKNLIMRASDGNWCLLSLP